MTEELRAAIRKTYFHLKAHDVLIPADLAVKARALGVIKASGDISSVNRVYHDAITQALTRYFEGSSITGPRNQFKQAMIQAFGDAFDLGWTNAGQELPVDNEDALSWLEARLNQEAGYIDGLFVQAKELRKDKEADFFAWATARADAYTATLQSIYNAAVMFAKGNMMLTWQLGNTEKHCSTCAKLDGGSHRASWYIARDYIPRKPGAAMDCGGYNCDCSLVDPKGNSVTI